MRYIMSVVLLVCGCTNASLDFSEKICFHAAFHRLLNMRCGSNVNVFFLTHFSVFFLLSYIVTLKAPPHLQKLICPKYRPFLRIHLLL